MEDKSKSSLLKAENGGGSSPDYNAVFGEKKINNKYSNKTVIGNVRNPKRFGWMEWVFLLLSMIALLGTLGITIERLVHFKDTFNSSSNSTESYAAIREDCDQWVCLSDFTFTVLLIVNLLFCFFYAFDGVLRERGFEMLGVSVAIAVVLMYITANYFSQPVAYDEPLRIARFILALVFGCPLALLGIAIYIKNGRLQFNIVGSNKLLMRIYRVRSFTSTLLNFNVHLVANFVILVTARRFTFIDEAEKYIIFVFLGYTILITPIGWIGFNYELRILTGVFAVLFFPSVAYYLYKIIDIVKNDYLSIEDNENYLFIAITLLIVCVIGLLMSVLVPIFAFLAARDYKKGLNDKVQPPFNNILLKCNKKREYDATLVGNGEN